MKNSKETRKMLIARIVDRGKERRASEELLNTRGEGGDPIELSRAVHDAISQD